MNNNHAHMNGNSTAHVKVRPASHAGSWYSDAPGELDQQLSGWLRDAGSNIGSARAIISPEQLINSHGSDAFEWMSTRNEEAEHSLEMQMPFIAKIMERCRPLGSFKIVPILVGSLSTTRQQFYGRIFANYLADPTNLFVISSDFCHWGQRFRYTPTESAGARPIYEQITTLDKQGMDAISTLDPSMFNEYLKKTQNTICGRNPICVLLQAFNHYQQTNNVTAELRFLKYAQSNKVRSLTDSSVSYAAGALFINPRN
uniref:Protein MEMO1 n=1 Tax=Meloidogyne javanica TaxID=6303 RepID=A0A915MSH7_MELJA